MPSWFENAPQSVIDEYSSLFAHHNKLTVSSFDEDNEIVHLRAPDGTSIIFDMLKAEARGALIDDDAAVKFFARIILGLQLRGEEIEIKFSDQFYNLKTRDEDLFDKVMERLCTNDYKDTNIPLWNKIMDQLGASCYLERDGE